MQNNPAKALRPEESAYLSAIRRQYEESGYAVVDEFLPQKTAERLGLMYRRLLHWEQQNQVRETHYQHVFKTRANCLPHENESYIARFGRSKELENAPEFTQIYEQVIRPCICETLDIRLTESDVRCYRLMPGDLYRTHIDDYAGEVGLIYYLNRHWVWDWGGILHLCSDDAAADQSLKSILPKFNRAVLINHRKFRFPHFINSVEPFAMEPRYTLVSFNK